MKRLSSTAAFAFGAGLMYLFDRERGRRRRSLFRDKLISAVARADDAFYKTTRDLDHRFRGTIASARSLFQRHAASDDVIQARIRSRIGRATSHPHAIAVKVKDGRVSLSGHVLANEVGALLSVASHVPGVMGLDNQLRIHQERGDIPALQGGETRSPQAVELTTKANWSPTARVFADTAGLALIVHGLRRRGLTGSLAGIAGLALLLRSATNMDIRRLTGIGAGPRAIDIRKTLNITAPLEDVFALWSRYPNFPRFMPHVRKIQDLGAGRSRWIIAGPAGIFFEWNAVVTDFIPNEVIAWKTEPGAAIEHAGIIRFDRNSDGSTRVDIRMSYNPVMGAIGHLIARMLGSDPKHLMDENLIRFKSLLEHGKATAAGQTITRDEVSI